MSATSTCAKPTARPSTSRADLRNGPVAALALAGAAIFLCAQAPAPAAGSRTLEQLAETLGRQHYLRTLCRGAVDQTWRNRMSRLLEVESAEEAQAERLTGAFNRGFTALRTRVPACNAAARAEAAANARRGAILAAAL